MLVDAEESLARVIRAENNAVELINEANELGTAIDACMRMSMASPARQRCDRGALATRCGEPLDPRWC